MDLGRDYRSYKLQGVRHILGILPEAALSRPLPELAEKPIPENIEVSSEEWK